MKITFVGAAHEVTGSCHYVDACGKRFLVDCGMEQGLNLFENIEIPVNPGELDFVLLTHAHIDHSGMLPKLYKDGFKGQIYATEATVDLCSVMLRDSAHIQESDAEWKNRKAMRAGQPQIEAIYTVADADATAALMIPVPYKKKIQVAEGIEIRFIDAGHLLGSASIEVWLTEDHITKKVVFSGDIGNLNQGIIKDPQYLEEADYILMESTYGDRMHESKFNEEIPDYATKFARIIQRTFDRGGNVVIPSFAVGRTQEILYVIREIKEKQMISGHEGFEVYIDSPLAIEATTIFTRHGMECYDEETMAVVNRGVQPFTFPGLKVAVTSDESKMINMDTRPKVIISASGMCDAGRIRHHLKHNLWRKECTVCFVGYQAVGTLGRKLVDGNTLVKIFGEAIDVKAEIQTVGGVSGHADQAGLLKWVGSFCKDPEKLPEKVFVIHGEDTVTDTFAELVTERFGVPAFAPYSGGSVDLLTGEIASLGVPAPIQKNKEKAVTRKANRVFERLVQAGKRLMAVIMENEGGANKDLAQFESQINNLCDKWSR